MTNIKLPNGTSIMVDAIKNYLSDIAEPEEVERWLNAPLEEWRGRTPMEELKAGNSTGVWNLVQRIKAGEGGY